MMAEHHTDTSGFTWKPYAVSFDSPEGEFSFHIYAISPDHAQLQVDAIKDSARVDGEVCQVGEW